MTIDPMKRTELSGPWAGFGFQQGHLWTPEGRSIEPHHMVWLSLTCNIAREWQHLMDDARRSAADPRTPAKPLRCKASNVIYLRDVLRERSNQGDVARQA